MPPSLIFISYTFSILNLEGHMALSIRVQYEIIIKASGRVVSQSFLTMRSWVRFPALPQFISGTEFTQPSEDDWIAHLTEK